MKKYIAFERDFLINRIQFILSLYLLLRLLNCNFLLSSDCLHCLKTFTNLFNSIILFNIFYESVTSRVLRSADHGAKLFTVCRAQPAKKVSCDWISGSVESRVLIHWGHRSRISESLGSKVLIQWFSWSIMYITNWTRLPYGSCSTHLKSWLIVTTTKAATPCYQVIACIAWRRLQISPKHNPL